MSYRTIVLKGDPLQKEAVANATISPGMIIERMSTGKVRAHASASQNVVPKLVAIEDALQGNEVGDDYAAADQVQFVAPRSGDEVALLLAAGESVSIGDDLVSNGDGCVKAYSAITVESAESETLYFNSIVGSSLETLDLSTSSAANTLIGVEIA